ncbi:hypothetical protein BCR44DRAFT_1426202 [Catenaria anguillulae PL171]|uniref:Uncharacterized protein n=1 Tax=Catenaria anguillulae PL171 TaxID=765915 RepID=A0A1Y2I3V4_9FUNG|nr:hypothetical protein BCR44DRAFT_1426202 [Catenaria anguillulae PL171]
MAQLIAANSRPVELGDGQQLRVSHCLFAKAVTMPTIMPEYPESGPIVRKQSKLRALLDANRAIYTQKADTVPNFLRHKSNPESTNKTARRSHRAKAAARRVATRLETLIDDIAADRMEPETANWLSTEFGLVVDQAFKDCAIPVLRRLDKAMIDTNAAANRVLVKLALVKPKEADDVEHAAKVVFSCGLAPWVHKLFLLGALYPGPVNNIRGHMHRVAIQTDNIGPNPAHVQAMPPLFVAIHVPARARANMPDKMVAFKEYVATNEGVAPASSTGNSRPTCSTVHLRLVARKKRQELP